MSARFRLLKKKKHDANTFQVLSQQTFSSFPIVNSLIAPSLDTMFAEAYVITYEQSLIWLWSDIVSLDSTVVVD